MHVRDPSAVSVELEAAVAATRFRRQILNQFALLLTAGVLVVSFQNCSVDMSTSTPGASTSGACSASAAQLTALQPVFDNFVKSACASCHGVTAGSQQTPFYTPDTTANGADTSTQQFLYLQLCSRGGLAVGTKIDGTSGHVGGTFSRGSAPQSLLYDYLTTNF